MSLTLPTRPEFLNENRSKRSSGALGPEMINKVENKAANETKAGTQNILSEPQAAPIVQEERKIIPRKLLQHNVENSNLNWKDLLLEQNNSYALLLQREWGLLSDRAHNLAPETEWSFLWLGNESVSKNLIFQFRGWLERFIKSFSWEGPKRAKVIFGQEDKSSVFTITWDKGDLPPPLVEMLPGWIILPTSEKDQYGFKMIYSTSFISTKAGRA